MAAACGSDDESSDEATTGGGGEEAAAGDICVEGDSVKLGFLNFQCGVYDNFVGKYTYEAAKMSV